MPDRRFFEHAGPYALTELAGLSGVDVDAAGRDLMIQRAAPLVVADERSVSFFSDRRYVADLKATKAAAVFVAKAFVEHVPEGTVAVVTAEPQAAWARAAQKLHPTLVLDNEGAIHPTAVLDEGVVIGPGAVLGANVRIGRGTVIGANTTIGPGVAIGRDCAIGSNVFVGCALVGDRVRLSAGVVVGEAGFGVAGSASGAVDVPQLGRVILQDGVTIGSNSCVDRGAFTDTVVGENTKIDNLVQIAHNVVLGRSCVVAAHTGISGSCKIGDGVMFGGAVGLADHLTIGDGARIAARSGLMHDVPAGETWGGTPAKPARQWFREMAWVTKQVAAAGRGKDEG
jgi:UDP-3-O-[3-hydroxymyristoyl] glucosamine N-acyltransferase